MAGRDRRILFVLVGVVAVAAPALGFVLTKGRRQDKHTVAADALEATTAVETPKPAIPRQATLYCEFYNFVGRTPKVGFYFTFPIGAESPVYEQVFQKEIDGSQKNFGGNGRPGPEWAFVGSDDPATLRSPDGEIQINLYGYKPVTGTTWFEAGLRSVEYLNLDGKCRRSAA